MPKNQNKKDVKKLPHAGHRQRVISKYFEHGLSPFQEHEVLELMLFFSIPRADTNLLAHRMLDEFGSLENILEACPEDLEAIPGVGKNTAALLTLFRAVWEYKNTKLYNKRIYLNDSYDIGTFCVKYFQDHTEESAIMLIMDSARKLKHVACISEGTVNETAMYPRKVMKIALTMNATHVVISHNHPGGNTQPSAADKKMTKLLNQTLDSINVCLVDHIICNEKFFSSLRERGVFDEVNR